MIGGGPWSALCLACCGGSPSDLCPFPVVLCSGNSCEWKNSCLGCIFSSPSLCFKSIKQLPCLFSNPHFFFPLQFSSFPPEEQVQKEPCPIPQSHRNWPHLRPPPQPSAPDSWAQGPQQWQAKTSLSSGSGRWKIFLFVCFANVFVSCNTNNSVTSLWGDAGWDHGCIWRWHGVQQYSNGIINHRRLIKTLWQASCGFTSGHGGHGGLKVFILLTNRGRGRQSPQLYGTKQTL